MSFELKEGLCIDELTETAELELLEPEWTELWLRSLTATPFQSPAWLIPWWRRFGGSGVWTFALRSAGRLVGVAPLFVYHSPHSNLRELRFIGTGISDYLDIFVELGSETSVASATFDYLQQNRDRWDVCDFQELRSDSALLQSCLDGIEPQSVCPFLRLPERFDGLSEVIPSPMREKLSYYGRRAAKFGEVSFALADEATFEQSFQALLDLHSAWWQSRGRPGMLSDAGIQRFHRAVARRFLSIGALRLHTMRIDGRIVGCLYAFSSAKRVYFYLSGFDPCFSKISPGLLLIAHGIEQAGREGALEFDFLRGEEPYKSSWGTQNRRTYRWRRHANESVGPIPDGERARRRRGLTAFRSADYEAA